MSTPLPPAQHGAVLTGIKATPSRWPPASLDPGCRRRPPATDREPGRSRDPTKSGLHGFRGLPHFECPSGYGRGSALHIWAVSDEGEVRQVAPLPLTMRTLPLVVVGIGRRGWSSCPP
jgi:hypothetical protein